MAETLLNRYTVPNEFEEPFFEPYMTGEQQKDAADYALGENGNLLYTGGGTFSWNAGTGILSWTADVKVTGYTTGPRFAKLLAQSIEVQDGEVLYFVMPRQLTSDLSVSLLRSGRVVSAGVRLHDLRIFAARVGSSIFFGNGLSLLSGQSGTVFGGGIGTGAGTLTQIIVGGAGGVTVTNGLGPVVTVEAAFAGNGVAPTVSHSDHTHAGMSHDHEAQLRIEPAPGTTLLNVDADAAITLKTLLATQVYRNGQRLSEGVGQDFTVNLGLKQITLLFSSVLNDKFIIDRMTS